jgi:hypothetical protein
MRRCLGIAFALLAALAFVGASAADDESAQVAVKLSTARAGAANVRLTVQVPAALRCGRPTGTLGIGFPKTETVPAAIGTGDVTVNGRKAAKVAVAGTSMVVTAPGTKGASCFSLVLGKMTVVVAAGAGLRNPSKPGTYVVRVHRLSATYRAKVRIR